MKLNDKGRTGEDGQTRWYDQHSHRWVDQDQIDKQTNADKITIYIGYIGYAAAACGFLWMVAMTFGS